MTFGQYIDNPLGKKSAVFSQRDMYKDLYTKKFDAVFMREAGKINYFLYHDKGKDLYFAHIKIPSEVVPKFYYDVVIRFSTPDNGLRVSPSLEGYEVQFFSNDPAFVFTYERVFHKLGMFVEECKERASKIALKRDPTETNPYETPGYVKSIYFAYLFMKKKGLFLKMPYSTQGKRYTKRELLSNIEDTDKKIADRQEEGARVEKERKKEKTPLATPTKGEPESVVKKAKGINPVKKIGTTKTVKATPIGKRVTPTFNTQKKK